jgi:hypothetical protein
LLEFIQGNVFKSLELLLNVSAEENNKDYLEYESFEALLEIVLMQRELKRLNISIGKVKKRRKDTSMEAIWNKFGETWATIQHLELKFLGQDYFFKGELIFLFEGLLRLKYLRTLNLSFQLLYSGQDEIDKVFEICSDPKILSVENFQMLLNDQKYQRRLKKVNILREEYRENNLIYE